MQSLQVTNKFSAEMALAQELAREAGTIISNSLQIGREKTWKEDHTPVTEIDKQINQLVIDKIYERFPDHSILAEEGSDLSRSKEYIWVCDPIDGTFPFMHGIPISTFALALVKNGQPLLGVIYDPFTQRLFSAQLGLGTYLNGVRIHTSNANTLSDASIGVIFWQGNMHIFTPLLEKLVNQGAKIFNLVSIAYMDVLVATGDFAGVIFPGTSPHDSASAKIIIEEAGGIYSSLTGEVDRFDQKVHGHIASANQEIHAQILSLLR